MHHARGFSLIEAMISLLVLSIGLLGLAQLQARLSMASSRLQASTQAYVLAASNIERLLASAGAEPAPAAENSAIVTTPATRYSINDRLATIDLLVAAEVRVQWEHPSGSEEIRLQTLANTGDDVTDARLLLPVD